MNWTTHDVFNQVSELRDYDLLAIDPALAEAIRRDGAEWAMPQLSHYAQLMGESDPYGLAVMANRHTPELHSFDTRGRRIDQVEFHPAWHQLMAMYRGEGLISLPFKERKAGRWTAWATGFYLHGQIEQGTLCPATMTQACIPLLQREEPLWALLGARLCSDAYDPRDLPVAAKDSIWVGMGMTEKQGGSDVRANTTVATPVAAGGRGGEYLLRGHKWFFSAPMCDAHLVVARVGEGGPFACFYVPRWRPDGSKNAVNIQRLKDKVGNRSNSSSEVEFHDAWGVLMGEEGKGIRTIIEMATFTRLNCVVGSAAILRQALVQAIAYARERHAFGKALAEQPLMRTVLADMALESEAALVLLMRLARAYERDDTPAERAWKRMMTPAAKFWVCKRGVELTGETMEVLGGNGYIQDGIVGRLFLEAPVNSIWEGSGNVMCLDVLRALAREPEAAQALLAELAPTALREPLLKALLQSLTAMVTTAPEELEALGRIFVQQLVLLAQACLLRQHAPAYVADAFIATRLGAAGQGGRVAGAIDVRGLDVQAILQRALAR